MYHNKGIKLQTNYFVFTLKIEITGDSEKLVTTYLDNLTYKPQDRNLYPITYPESRCKCLM